MKKPEGPAEKIEVNKKMKDSRKLENSPLAPEKRKWGVQRKGFRSEAHKRRGGGCISCSSSEGRPRLFSEETKEGPSCVMRGGGGKDESVRVGNVKVDSGAARRLEGIDLIMEQVLLMNV